MARSVESALLVVIIDFTRLITQPSATPATTKLLLQKNKKASPVLQHQENERKWYNRDGTYICTIAEKSGRLKSTNVESERDACNAQRRVRVLAKLLKGIKGVRQLRRGNVVHPI